MNEEYKGELRLADGTPVGKVVDFQFEHRHFDPPKYDFRELFKPVEVKLEGAFIPGEGINDFIETIYKEYYSEKIVCYVSQKTMWMLRYHAQGKWYPNPRKRKSKMRMSKKWRNRA